MQNISFKQYRNIDLTVLAVLLLLSEGITTLATTKWFVGVPFALLSPLMPSEGLYMLMLVGVPAGMLVVAGIYVNVRKEKFEK